jgi:hypothetical protein
MKFRWIIFAAFGAVAFAQPPVAPTPETAGKPTGDNLENYNVVQSFEFGYRWNTTGGDLDMYRSTVNYGNGVRLLSSSLTMQSREGHGHYFDQLQLQTLGLGNDPYESVSFRIEKNRLYRYDLLWRSTDYFNPALPISSGEHAINTTRIMQDHDLTLFPDSSIRFFMGYSRNTERGPALTTTELFGRTGDEYVLFAPVQRSQQEFRLGAEAHMKGFTLNLLHGWVGFKEDAIQTLGAPSAGNNPNDLNVLNSYRLNEPYHGESPYWRVGLFKEGKRLWAMNGRFTYVAGRRNFAYNEFSTGTLLTGAPTTLQVMTTGNAERPALTGNLNLTLFPTSFATITNQTTYYNIRMVGNSYFVQGVNGVLTSPVLPFTFLGIQTFGNSTDVQLRIRRWLTVHAGYDYADRRISSVEGVQQFATPAPGPPATTPLEQSNPVNSGALGVVLRPIKGLTIGLDGEIGRARHPIYPISDRNYQTFRGRAEYRAKTLRLSAYAKTDYNTNSITLTSYASHVRQYGGDVSWAPKQWFAIDAGYVKLHLNTLGGIDYFVNNIDISGERSLYISNVHTASLGVRFALRQRADLYVGYSHIQDVGDGRATPFGARIDTSLPAFQAAQTFPLRFESPQARLSIRLHQKLRVNTGYQYYGYNEKFSGLQDYRAHTGYSSLTWSF